MWIAEAMSAAAMGEADGRGWDVKGESVIELGAGESEGVQSNVVMGQ